MTLKLKNMIAALDKVPDAPHELRVSANLWDQMMKEFSAPEGLTTMALNEVPVIVEPHYHPNWWSEHYADTIILHTEKGSITIPGVKLHHAIRPLITMFEIKEPE